MKRWMLSIVVTLMALAPVAAEASRDKSSLTGTILASAQSTSPVDYTSSDNAWNLLRAARRYATNGQLTQAAEALVQAEQRTRLLSNSATLEQLLGKIAAEYAKLGQYDRAIAITTSMGYTTLPPQACCVPLRTEAEIAIAEAYVKAGQINQAQQFAERIQSTASRYQVFVPIVVALAEQGRFADAIALSKRINDATQVSRARYGIAKGYISADRVLEGVEFIKSVVDPTERVSLLTLLSQWASRSGQYDRAYRIANQIQDAGTKGQVLTEVAIAYANAGQRGRASTILSQAYEIARKQPPPQAVAQWVGNFAQIGAFDRALEIAARLKDYESG
ncbi:hypothetical protein H6F43_01250, partial [Leptolyngbya sp. FACHB-36]|uniref:tetratricopeptide repeat protein n=1 Tax=Leptolyngbya sp. FACHB-36 TaxID=2692808 RepID=UPI0016803D35